MDDAQQREVAAGLQRGKPEAWRMLYDEYSRGVWRWVARLMGPQSADVADVVQETFLAAAGSARRFDPSRGSLWLWLCGIARNQVALSFRKRKRRAPSAEVGDCVPDAGEPPPDEVLAAGELASSVRGVLRELPADYGTLLTAKYCDGATANQIAAKQQCSAAAVRSKLARARRAFRRAFAKTATGSHDPQARAQR